MMIKRISTLVAASILLGACSSGESDGTTTTETNSSPDTEISVTYTHPSAQPLTYTIQCSGTTGTVEPDNTGIDPTVACQRLADPVAIDLLTNGPDPNRMCTEIYGGPDEAKIIGNIGDSTVDVTITRTNGCGINDWDVVLAGVLPDPIGALG